MTEHTPIGTWLYESLPEVYRVRDAADGYPLRDFLAVLGEQGDVLQEEAERLYDNQFIETCEEWLVPYIGALVGYRPVHDIVSVSQRALVGQWIELVRSKGTAATLEEVGRGATGWPAKVVEYFQNLAHPQFMNHIRPGVHGAVDTRNAARLEALGTAFDNAHYTVDVGRIAPREGRHNIHNNGLFLWRLGDDLWPRHQAFKVDQHNGEVRELRYALHPLGLNTQVFNTPVTEIGADARASQVNLPIPLSRRFLQDNLADFYPHAFCIWVKRGGEEGEVPKRDLAICDLSDDGTEWAHAPTKSVGFDPVLGRIAMPSDYADPESVEIRAYTAFPGHVGGGAYGRRASFATDLSPVLSVAVTDDLQTALDSIQSGVPVEIVNSETYDGAFTIDVAADQRRELRAKDGQRPTLELTADLQITGAAQSEVSVNGLFVAGGALIVPATRTNPITKKPETNELRRLTLRHMTLLPGIRTKPDGTPEQPAAPSLIIEATNVIVQIENSIVGGIRCDPSTVIEVTDSAVDATSPTNVALAELDGLSPAARVTLQQTTVIGKINARVFSLVSNSIIDASVEEDDAWKIAVQAIDTQSGCARFSYIPPGSRVPRRYRCQPSLALAEALRAAEEAKTKLSSPEKAAIIRRVLTPLRPAFTERRYGGSAYLQLRTSAPVEIRTGADDESEMGVWHMVHQPQRESNLLIRLEEFLPTGLEAGFFYET